MGRRLFQAVHGTHDVLGSWTDVAASADSTAVVDGWFGVRDTIVGGAGGVVAAIGAAKAGYAGVGWCGWGWRTNGGSYRGDVSIGWPAVTGISITVFRLI